MADFELQSVFHFTVCASDFERSLDFYQRIGFQLLRDNRDIVWPDYVAENFGLKRAQGRGALLAAGAHAQGLRDVGGDDLFPIDRDEDPRPRGVQGVEPVEGLFVESLVIGARTCLGLDEPPVAGEYCEHCAYVDVASGI